MSDKDRKKHARPEDTYISLRLSFWILFYALVLLSSGMGAAIAVVVIRHIANPLFLLGSRWPWVLLALSAMCFIGFAAFSSRLMLTWAQLLRYARYQEERGRTIIAAKDVTVYAENEERRDKELRDEVKGIGDRIKDSMSEQIRSSNQQTEEIIRTSMKGLNDQMYALVRSLSERLEKVESRPYQMPQDSTVNRLAAEIPPRNGDEGPAESHGSENEGPDPGKPSDAAVDEGAAGEGRAEGKTEEDAGSLPDDDIRRRLSELRREESELMEIAERDFRTYSAIPPEIQARLDEITIERERLTGSGPADPDDGFIDATGFGDGDVENELPESGSSFDLSEDDGDGLEGPDEDEDGTESDEDDVKPIQI